MQSRLEIEVVDAHAHFFTANTLKAWSLRGRTRDSFAAMGFMVGNEAYDEFIGAKKRFPGRFMGYANINPKDRNAVTHVKRAANDELQGIKLYPSSWGFHAYDKVCYPVYEEALKRGLLVFLHFGITIGGQADLRHGNPLDIQLPSGSPSAGRPISATGTPWTSSCLPGTSLTSSSS
jgi:predicted TIM-barrel fold metal-dependent hydrolase